MAAGATARRRQWNVRLPLRLPWSGVTFRDATIIEGPAGFGEISPLPTKIRVDANGAWDLDTATRRLRVLARYDLELAEQSVASLEDMARLGRLVDVRLAADEAVRDVADARRLIRLGAADAEKVQPLGGLCAALAWSRGPVSPPSSPPFSRPRWDWPPAWLWWRRSPSSLSPAASPRPRVHRHCRPALGPGPTRPSSRNGATRLA
ncbi:MAG TPA: enolase C-terminal domain-like protein [Acidimicrobiales bacterium]|jgi:hypothetical protein